MKKILSVLLIAAFTAVLGFSQDLKFSGYMNYGLGVEFTSEDLDPKDEYSAKLRMTGVDSEQIGGRFRLNGSYSNEDKTAGADLRIQLQGNYSNPSASTSGLIVPSGSAFNNAHTHNASLSNVAGNGDATYNLGLAYAYGWIKPIDFLLIKAGIVDDGSFVTAGAILRDDAGAGAGTGLFIKLTPIEGLAVGAGAYSRSADGSNNNNRIENVGGMSNDWYKTKYTAGISYTMPEMFKINTSFRSANDAGVSSRSQARAVGEVQLFMIENLTAIFEVEADNLFRLADHDKKIKTFEEDGKINIFETFAYKMGDLRFGLNAAQYMWKAKEGPRVGNNGEKNKPDLGLRFNPWISYALIEGKIVPRLDAVYFLAGDRSTGGDAGKYDRRMDVAPTYNKEESVINVRPSVRLNIDSRTSFEIGTVTYIRQPDKVNKDVNKGNSYINNVFYTDLVVRF
ncbi:MAG: hypothetical protein LBH07_08820 [Treponema sp.]|jgi:hypothetical protein|nr:hypothetical protein [Treponema sp.]